MLYLMHSQMLRRSSHNIGRNIGSYLPDMITEMWEPARDFASLKLPSAGVRSLVALSSHTPQVIVVTSEGFFYQYNIDLEIGGECVLVKQHRYGYKIQVAGFTYMYSSFCPFSQFA